MLLYASPTPIDQPHSNVRRHQRLMDVRLDLGLDAFDG